MDSRFPGPDDFHGDISRRSGDAEDGGQATYTGSLVVTMLARVLVENVLPQGLRLAYSSAGSAEHPIIHLVGHQRDPVGLSGGQTRPIPYASDYQEMILLVPFVLYGSGTQLHNYAAWMYLDDLAAIGIGNSVYAYAKQLARLDESSAGLRISTQVASVFGKTYFVSDVRVTGPWRSASDAAATLPRWADLKAILEMPVVGVDLMRTVCSYFEWSYADAEVAPALSTHRFVEPFRKGMSEWPRLGLLSGAPDGTVALRNLRWRLALPPPSCRF